MYKIAYYFVIWMMFAFSGVKADAQKSEASAVSIEKEKARAKRTIQTIFGPLVLDHPALIKLHDHRIIQRLKGVNQLGAYPYFVNRTSFSRYDHSIGVLWLVKQYGGSLNEQLAALAHDASHTVFSHVADVLFQKEGYQDHIHEWFLEKMHIDAVLSEFNITVADIIPDRPEFKRLEQPYPNMCADRIQYNLNNALAFEMRTSDEIQEILQHLKYEADQWFFDNIKAAYSFAKISLYLTKALYGSPENVTIYHWTVKLLKRAKAIGLIKHDDIHFSEDQNILKRLRDSDDDEIRLYLKYLTHHDKHFKEVTAEDQYDLHHKTKMRGIDPLVKTQGEMKRLSELHSQFKREYQALQEFCNQGVYIQFLQ